MANVVSVGTGCVVHSCIVQTKGIEGRGRSSCAFFRQQRGHHDVAVEQTISLRFLLRQVLWRWIRWRTNILQRSEVLLRLVSYCPLSDICDMSYLYEPFVNAPLGKGQRMMTSCYVSVLGSQVWKTPANSAPEFIARESL